MKKRYKLVLILLGIINAFCISLCIIRNSIKVDSIGVIGGADGPTDIIVSKAQTNNVLLFIITGVFFLGFITLLIIVRKKK